MAQVVATSPCAAAIVIAGFVPEKLIVAKSIGDVVPGESDAVVFVTSTVLPVNVNVPFV